MANHPYGWLSLLPPVLAIVLAMMTRRVVVSLLAGILLGALITNGGDVIAALGETLEIHLWKTLVDEDKLRVFAFTLLMGAMVDVIHRSGGMRGLVDLISPWARTRQRGQLAAWLLGLLVFFDDYANTVLLGKTLRPLFDRLRISREKLAYIVDSTAAPVAGLALVSTWVAGEIGFVQDGLDNLSGQVDANAFELFVASIPYRFYVIWSLVLVALVAALGRDLGPMVGAERRALDADDAAPTAGSQRETTAGDAAPNRWYNAVVPVGMTVLAMVWLLYTTGRQAIAEQNPAATPTWGQIFGEADAFYALLWGSLAGLTAALVLAGAQRLMNAREMLTSVEAGARTMLPALVILWLASALSGLSGNKPVAGDVPSAESSKYPLSYRLYTAEHLTGMVANDQQRPSPLLKTLLPTIVFVLAAAVSFATGTSWGTMGVVMPLVVPLAYSVMASGLEPVSMNSPIMLGSIGSVLAGAIFGDHCSPISDTTVLSSHACGCEHTAHVWTQLPYALLAGAVTVLAGTLPIGMGAPVEVLLPIGPMALALVLLLAGSKSLVSTAE